MTFRRYLCILAAWLGCYFLAGYLPPLEGSAWYAIRMVDSVILIELVLLSAIALRKSSKSWYRHLTLFPVSFLVLETIAIMVYALAMNDQKHNGGYYYDNLEACIHTINSLEIMVLVLGGPWLAGPRPIARVADFFRYCVKTFESAIFGNRGARR